MTGEPIDTDTIREREALVHTDGTPAGIIWLTPTERDALCDEVDRLRAAVDELAMLFEDHTGAAPHISTGVVERPTVADTDPTPPIVLDEWVDNGEAFARMTSPERADRSDGGGSEDSTTASEHPATAEPPSAPVTASKAARHEAEAYRHEQIKGTAHGLLRAIGDPPPPHLFHPTTALRRLLEDADVTPLPPDGVASDGSPTWQGEPHPPPTHTRGGRP